VGTTGQTLTVIADDLIDLIHSVDPAYRENGVCSFMMNDASLKVIRKLKDTTGRPIFMPGYDGLSGPMADSVLGHSVTINQDVAVMAANAKSILFGDFSNYYVRDVMGATLFRFDDSAYIKLGQIGFLMWMRSGGNLLDANAIKYYQNSAS
jgi:HK97 family phage major capsid protein